MKLIAVQGCTIVCKTSSVTVASYQIATPPDSTVSAEGKPIYKGTLSVVASGIVMGAFTCPSATFTIAPTVQNVASGGQAVVVQGDSGSCTCTGTNPKGDTTTITFTSEISVAGQTSCSVE